MAKPQNSKTRVVVQSIRDGDKQTMPDMQQTLDHGTVPSFTRTMPDMFKNMSKEITVTIQTTGQRGGPDLSVGSP